MSPATHIESDLIEFLLVRQPCVHRVSHPKLPVTVGLDAQAELLESGVLDSLLLLDLMLHIQSNHGVSLLASDVTPANFRNISTLAQLVARRSQCKNPGGKAA